MPAVPGRDAELIAFDWSHARWRIQSCGTNNSGPYARVIPYLDAMDVYKGLDLLAGSSEDWSSNVEVIGERFVLVTLSIGSTSKRDGAPIFADGHGSQSDPFRLALDQALKRAARQFGIGRALRQYGSGWAEVLSVNKPPEGKRYKYKTRQALGRGGDEVVLYWNPPAVQLGPEPARVAPAPAPKPEPPAPAQRAVNGHAPSRELGGGVAVPDIDPALRAVPQDFDEKRRLFADLIEFGEEKGFGWQARFAKTPANENGVAPAALRAAKHNTGTANWFTKALLDMVRELPPGVFEGFSSWRAKPRGVPAKAAGPIDDDLPF